MDYAVPSHIVNKYSVEIAYFAPPSPPVARDAVISSVINVEHEFKLYILAVLRKINPDISSSEFDQKGIFSEPNMLSSLSKCLTLASVLKVIHPDEEEDLRCLVAIRNMYAHGRDRKEFKEDVNAVKFLKKMKIYQNSIHSLKDLNAGKAFLCCTTALSETIINRTEALIQA